MNVYIYDKTFDGLLTAVFDAYFRKTFPDFLLSEGDALPLFYDELHTVVTDEEKAARSAAIQKATKQAALVPLEVARKALDMMSVIADVARLGNRNAVTDACVAMMSARTAVLGALLNVRINLGSLKDRDFVLQLQTEADAIEQTACQREKELLDAVNQDLCV